MSSKLSINVFLAIYFAHAVSFTDSRRGQSQCVPGEILEGPSCTTFTRCVQGRIYNRKVKFDCPPGTSFHVKEKICNYISSDCASEFSSNPQPSPVQVEVFLPVGPDDNDSGEDAGPPGIPPPSIPAPPGHSGASCPTYELDPDSIFECNVPGLFPSTGDCSKFYRCVNTMGCILKGLYVACPENHLFDTSQQTCVPKSLTGKCPFVLDDGYQIQIEPVIQLDESNVEKFFLTSAYWRLMPYIPDEKQRILRVPGHHSRESPDATFSMKS